MSHHFPGLDGGYAGESWPQFTQCYTWALHTFQILKLHIQAHYDNTRQHIENHSFADIPLPTNIRLVKAMVFPLVMYGCESWAVKKAERPRIDAFVLFCFVLF